MAENAEIIKRINFYVHDKHGGNKSALARDWGTSYPQLAAILNGSRGVPASMIRTSADKGYNVNWLLTGEGEPYLATTETVQKESQAGYVDKLLASKDEIILLQREKIDSLQAELLTKKVPGVATKKKSAKIVHLKTING